MLNYKELKKFHQAVLIIDEFFDMELFDIKKLDKVVELGEQLNLEGINVLLNKNELNTANELLEEMFNINIEKINEDAYKIGFDKIYQ